MSNKEISDKDVTKIEKDLRILIEQIKNKKNTIGELISEKGKYNLANDIERILAEQEQDKNRIQELEAKKWNDLDNTNFENYIEEIVKERTKDYISKQKIEDVIESKIIDISGFECIALEDLQELLEGEE